MSDEGRLFDAPSPAIGTIWSVRGNRVRWRALTANDIRLTPRAFFDELDAEFHFTVDVAARPENALCSRYFTPEDDGLKQDWTGERCWMNPPYSFIEPWARKAADERATTVALLPARTDLRWFHEYVMAVGAEVRFVRGRLRFGQSTGNAPFPSMVVIWRNDEAGA